MQSKIFIGDSREILPTLEPTAFDLLVTSPPYFVSRGYEDWITSEEEYWDIIEAVFAECDRVMKPSSKIVVNFADRYANSKYIGRPKEICYVPNYIDIMENTLDYDLWARIIWDKKNVMLDGARHLIGGRFNGEMRVSPNWEYIFVWRKRGDKVDKNVDLTKEEWTKYSDGVWQISSVASNPEIENTKLAMFPEELPRRLIKMYTEKGDNVLDPFVGSGTTVLAARNQGRNGIGIEKNPAMRNILEEKLCATLFDEAVRIL